MPTCLSHPRIEETWPCAACGRPFCDLCLVELMGQKLCMECKHLAVSDIVERRQRHPLALVSLLVPAIGYVLCAPLLVPVTSLAGLFLGWRTLREIAEQPRYSGRSLALIALVVAGGTLGAWLMAVMATLMFYVQSR